MKKRARAMEVEDKSASMFLLPPAPNKCQECACEHEPGMPHNKQSLFYCVKFKMKHGRDPTWKDAMAHCSEETKELWVAAIQKTLDEETRPAHIEALKKCLEEVSGG